MRFFFSYQLGYMYFRYFMWNFSGRQNDILGYGEVANGNWITGIKFIDEQLVGPQDDLPDDIAERLTTMSLEELTPSAAAIK